MSRLALFLLGPPLIELDGEPLRVNRRKAVALIAYLAVTGGSHARDSLATLLWPELDQTRGRAALRRTLAALKEALGEEWLEVDRESLALRRGGGFWLDVDRLHDLLAVCRTHGHRPDEVCPACLAPLAEAASLCRDDFMAGFTLRDSVGFDDWQSLCSESLRDELSGALKRLAHGHGLLGEFEPALAHARRWLALDPLHEPAHRCLMQLYAQAGQRAAALRQYRECVQILQRELGLPPEEETTRAYEAIQENRVSRPAGPATRSHNLPIQPTPFIGREEELAEIDRLLKDPGCRLLTLVGPGGVGKTRLAIQAALRAAEGGLFSHGVRLVPLVALSGADQLVPTIAASLDLPLLGSTDPRRRLLDYLRDREMLLVLDNFEHLLSAAGLLSEILTAAPGVTLLVTSRECLNLQWEWLLEIRGLKVPERGQVEEVEACDAVRLFAQSGRRVRPDLSLGEEEKPFVIRVCRMVDGLPLGIELAAAWLQMLSCREIAQEIEGGLSFLVSPLQDLPERHRSLRAVFGHSWSLLSAEEKRACRRLSVFRGGFREEAAAEEVADASLSLLLALVRRSFLRRSPTGRYEMLEVMRQYAEKKLQEHREKEDIHDRHCGYYAEFLCEREERLRGEKQEETLDEIEEEMGNVRAAWQWAVVNGKVEAIGKFMDGLCFFCEMRSWYREGEEAFGRAAQGLGGVDRTPSGPGREKGVLLGRALARQGWFCQRLGRFEKARELLQRSLSTLIPLGAPTEVAFSLHCLGAVAWRVGEYAEARQMLQESLAIRREHGDRWGTAVSLNVLGIVAKELGEYAEAERRLRESLAIHKSSGNRRGMASCLQVLGLVASMSARYAAAKRLLEESLAIYREGDSQPGIAVCLGSLGSVAEAMGEYAEAERLHRESLAICREIGNRWGVAICLKNLGSAVCGMGEHREASKRFLEALETAMDIGAIPWALEALVGMATLLMGEGKREQAVEFVTHTLYHPAAPGVVKDRAERLLSELESGLAPELFAAARERGQAKETRELVQMFLG